MTDGSGHGAGFQVEMKSRALEKTGRHIIITNRGRPVFLAGPLHADPVDRVIATALIRDIPIVTKDRKIRDYPGIKSIW